MYKYKECMVAQTQKQNKMKVLENYTEVPQSFVGREILVNSKYMIWQNLIEHYCYL